MNKKRVLITGATGLVGSSVLSTLGNEYEFYALVRSKPYNCYENVTYFEHNFSNGSLPANLPSKIDVIIHLAQSNNMRDFPAQAADIFKINVSSTALLLDYGQKSGATHFIFASTGGLYGTSMEPCREDMPVQLTQGHLNYYFRTKYASENLIQAYNNLMSVHILRPFFIYGQNQKKDMFIPRLIENVRNGKPITLQGEQGVFVNPVHVSDAVKLINECMSISDSLTINLAGPDILSIQEISQIIGIEVGKEPVFSFVDGNANNIIGNNDLMRRIIKRPLMKFQTGILDVL